MRRSNAEGSRRRITRHEHGKLSFFYEVPDTSNFLYDSDSQHSRPAVRASGSIYELEATDMTNLRHESRT